MFNGNSLSLAMDADGVAELRFDRRGEPINKFDHQTTEELRAAVGLLAQSHRLRGLLVTSAKASFIVGADIGEFEQRFRAPEHALAHSLWKSNEVFMALEDLPVPSVVAINGHALGGGCELALTAAFRVMATDASIGVPEVSLGLFPGFGGTVRLPRVGGPAVAIEWIARGAPHAARVAHEAGVVDAVCPPADLRDFALAWLRRAMAGEIDWRTRQAAKRASVPMPPAAHAGLFAQAAADCAAAPDAAHQPAASMAVALMARTTLLPRDAAQWQECEAFARVARTQAGRARVQAFLDERAVSRGARNWTRRAPTPLRVAVHGTQDGEAGIQAIDGVPFVALRDADLIVVPAGGDAQRLRLVLDSARAQADPNAAIACVTKHLWADAAADNLPDWEMLVRLNFHDRAGPRRLVEVLRGPSSSDAAVARAVAFAVASNATPVVARLSGGPFVPPLMASSRSAWLRLLAQGVSEDRLQSALRAFGWAPEHAAFVPPAIREFASDSDDSPLSHEAIVDRLLLPMVVAAAAALEADSVGSAAELDTAVRLAAGMPVHVGGPLQYADWLGLAQVVERLDACKACQEMPAPTPAMREMARVGRRYHQKETETPE